MTERNPQSGLARTSLEDALEQHRLLLGESQRLAHIGSWIMNVADQTIVWSDEAFRLFGLEPGEVQPSMRDFSARVHPEDADAVQRHVHRTMSTAHFETTEYRILRTDGAVRRIRATGDVSVDETGRPTTVVGTMQDITESWLADQALRASEDKYRRLHETMIDGFAAVDMSGRIVEANQAYQTMLGYTEAELRELSYIDLTPEKWHSLEAEIVENTREYGYSRVYEKEYRRKDGTIFPVELRGYVLRNAAGEQTGMWAIVRDITERRKAEQERAQLEQQIQQAQKLESLGVLAGGIAHDFNNILASILGNADLALHKLDQVSPARLHLKDIEVASRRAAELCRQMLAYSGSGRFVIEVLDVNDLVREMAHMLDVAISKRAVLRFDLRPAPPMIEADATQIRQIVMNLITNAAEAIGERHGVITLRTGELECDVDYLKASYLDDELPAGRYAFLEVSDTGQGMDEQTRRRLFDPFFTTKFTGRGLGMAAILGIVRGHRGAIRITSEPGAGSTIRVLFPRALKAPAAHSTHPARMGRWRGSGTALLVDDDAGVRDVGAAMLQQLGFDTITAESAQLALDRYAERGRDITVVLLDLTMPQMNGADCFRALRRIDPDARIILSSGYSQQDVVARFKGEMPTGFIQKPYQLHSLEQILKAALDRPTEIG